MYESLLKSNRQSIEMSLPVESVKTSDDNCLVPKSLLEKRTTNQTKTNKVNQTTNIISLSKLKNYVPLNKSKLSPLSRLLIKNQQTKQREAVNEPQAVSSHSIQRPHNSLSSLGKLVKNSNMSAANSFKQSLSWANHLKL